MAVVRALPLVTIHVAQSLDGRLGLEGRPTPLSSPEGLTSAHLARAAHDAVLVGRNTIRIDDPRLTVRHEVSVTDVTATNANATAKAAPLRVVLASRLDVPPSARVLERPGRALVIGAEGYESEGAARRLRDAGAEVVTVTPTADGRVSLVPALEVLHTRFGVQRLLVEGGARVLTSFLREKLVHRVEIEIAMRLLGAPGTPTLDALGVERLEQAPALENVSVERLGESLLIRADVRPS